MPEPVIPDDDPHRYDEEPDDDFDPRWDEDEYLDDPRRGQARDLNRRHG